MNLRKTLATTVLASLVGTAAFFGLRTDDSAAAKAASVSAAPRDGSSNTAGALDRQGSARVSISSTDRQVTTQGAVDAISHSQLLHRPGQGVAGTDTGQWASMTDFMTFVLDDAAAVWSWYYQQWGYSFSSQARYVFPEAGQVVVTGCGDATNDTTMEYCSLDDTVYFSQALATALWDGSFRGYDGWYGKGGDFAVATMLAHEFGHNVQAELGIQQATYGLPKHEQHADCLSGAFTKVAGMQGILDPNDLSEGVTTAFVVGDSWFDNPTHHGTPQERMNAWSTGYNAAGPAGCDSVLTG